jgi:hypothetical protein
VIDVAFGLFLAKKIADEGLGLEFQDPGDFSSGNKK